LQQRFPSGACLPLAGCPGMSSKAPLPFYGVREGLAVSERDPNGPSRMTSET
jgi:hypothetical protein